MESLISYESDDENKEHVSEINPSMSAKTMEPKNQELDVNYDPVEMDESDEEDSCHDVPLICTSIVSPEDAPLVFRPTYAPGDDVRCVSLDSRNSSDMEMDDNESDLETEIQILERNDTNLEEVDMCEDEPRSNKGEQTDSPSKETENGDKKQEIEPESRSKSTCKRPHSPQRVRSSSPRHVRDTSRSPERPRKNPRLERKTSGSEKGVEKTGAAFKSYYNPATSPKNPQIVDKTGFGVKVYPNSASNAKYVQQIQEKTGITLPAYYNPAVMNPVKYAQQIQKRQLLWGNKNNDSKPSETNQSVSNPWSATTFKNDSDGKMTEKFKRLMGIREEPAAAPPKVESNEVIEKQEEMFSNMEAQYQVARMVTHTHRGVGLGYASHPSRTLQKNS